MNLQQYIKSINKRFDSGISREHSYRGDLEELIRCLVPDVEITNEPANVTDCGNPDYVITKGEIPIGFIEAKDIGKDLNSKANKEQFDRYRKALDNLIITDYIWFQFFQEGELVAEIRIGQKEATTILPLSEKIAPLTENFAEFTGLIQNFCTYIGNTIKSPKKLASMMAAKARLLQVILEKAITSDEETQDNSELQQQFKTFKDILIHDLDPQGFADIYAQTLAYGMFAARLHDETLDTFSRQEAAELIPKSNPFLRKLFNHVAGADIDERIKTTVDNLADVFRATDVKALLKNFGKTTQTQDPIIHFYETFLAEYDPKLRKARGVWYTPEPVVNFIVRGVDEILKTEFGLKDGLADTAKTTIKLKKPTSDGRKKGGYAEVEKEVHKVQVLDPATGTGTFLAEVVKFIYNGKFKAMQGAWSGYVDEHLIPRLNGFELLMASYAMAHLKLDMLLRDTGFKASKNQRLNIYLTNSLEEHHPDTGTLFSSWLSSEANEANHIKRDTPVMVVMGNPPYSGISINKGKWITDLIDDYKYVDGEHFNERKHWLNDDYVKFIRYGQHFIDKNGEGVLAYINNHSFLSNPTFRGMRWHLLNSFDEIYIIDLHGNSLRHEVCPDGSPDKNVFDIQAGVSINFFIKTGKKKKGNLAKVFHTDFWGSRQYKYDKLTQENLTSLNFEKISFNAPYYFFIPKEDKGREHYEEKGFLSSNLFKVQSMGITSARDSVVIDFSSNNLKKRMAKFINPKYSDQEVRHWLFPKKKDGKYAAGDSRGWSLPIAREKVANENHENHIIPISYRPFDIREIYYSPSMVDWCRQDVMKHMLTKENLAFISVKLGRNINAHNFFITNNITDKGITSSLDNANVFPLYLYPEEDKQQSLQNTEETLRSSAVQKRVPNLDTEIVESIAKGLGLQFVPEKEMDSRLRGNDETGGTFAPIDLLDYIYAVLHSPSYRETYKEFLKIDFPRIPYPKDVDKFWALVKLGGELRQIHLLESPTVENYITTYPAEGDNIITRKMTKTSLGFELLSDTTPSASAPTPSQPKGNDDAANSPLTRGVARSDGVSSNPTGRVWINDNQYFDNVPLIAWEFYIGGYQPAQKWLKDRQGRKLSFDDILHYQKIIVALSETHRIMQEIDKFDI
jgi:predicted helicase